MGRFGRWLFRRLDTAIDTDYLAQHTGHPAADRAADCQAAMRGALEADGNAFGVLADGLEKMVMNREHRNLLLEGRLTLISLYDPGAGFNVGNAMQRNKLIYALADASLVINSDVGKGGTWAGAVEQLDKLKFVPVYVRTTGEPSAGLEALRKKGALPWPNPNDVDSFKTVFSLSSLSFNSVRQPELMLVDGNECCALPTPETIAFPVQNRVSQPGIIVMPHSRF